MKTYSPKDDYCEEAKNKQSVESENDFYSCADDYHMGTIQDDKIYISTTNDQHNQICNNQEVTADGGLSGYFSDQATIDECKDENGVLDNTKYNEMCQIQPWRKNGMEGSGDATYKPHIDCFEIDRDALEENYGTRDFNAAIAKCEANNQFGAGEGNQGYNPYISEMISNGSLKHVPEESYSDKNNEVCNRDNLNQNELKNSVVESKDYDEMMKDAKARQQDCLQNNTSHPSKEVQKNTGDLLYAPETIPSETGHATPVDYNKYENLPDTNNLYDLSNSSGEDNAPKGVDTNCLSSGIDKEDDSANLSKNNGMDM